MTYTVDLALDVEMALATLSDDDHQEAMELVAAALVDPNSWPVPGRWDRALRYWPCCASSSRSTSTGSTSSLGSAATVMTTCRA